MKVIYILDEDTKQYRPATLEEIMASPAIVQMIKQQHENLQELHK